MVPTGDHPIAEQAKSDFLLHNHKVMIDAGTRLVVVMSAALTLPGTRGAASAPLEVPDLKRTYVSGRQLFPAFVGRQLTGAGGPSVAA